MTTWSDSPFPRLVDGRRVPVPARVLAEERGEARYVYRIGDRPGWLAKIYKDPLSVFAAEQLRLLIEAPGLMTDRDRALVDRSTAWPVARIQENDRTVGIVMAESPGRVTARIRLRGGRMGDPEPLEVDWLVASEAMLARAGLRAPTAEVRLRAVHDLLTIGDLFERYGVVYGDWSYNNAFWAPGSGEVFLIDMDSCRIGRRPWIQSPEWTDPLYPDGSLFLDKYSDRFKLAALSVRCLTGRRGDVVKAWESLPDEYRMGAPGRLLRQAIRAQRAEDRPSPGRLLEVLSPIAPERPSTSGGAGAVLAPIAPMPRGGVAGSRPVRGTARASGDQAARHPSHPPSPDRRYTSAQVRRPHDALGGRPGPDAGATPGPYTSPGRPRSRRGSLGVVIGLIVVAVSALALFDWLSA
ncbi:hypothetical protein [Rhizohabitans arisaemae]|uniref:hypothetical protein n=1 Tax=Rhizohabitans arisaemae TaxID=2720610 RepID=UPI0024B1B230|nr:hypothetical protein [Rhizohabitans arisaemae]